jgi:hypothetical protein
MLSSYGHGLGDRSEHRTLGPLVRLVAADHEREEALGSMLADRETEASAQREADVVGSIDPGGIEDGDGITDPRGQVVRRQLVRLVAATLAAVVGEDETEVRLEGVSERRCLRVLEGVGEACVDEHRVPVAGVFEERPDPIGFIA